MTAGKNQDFADNLSGLTFDEDELSHKHLESQLCIPQDRLEDIEFFPNFNDDLIRLSEVLPLELESLSYFDDIACKQDGVNDFWITGDAESTLLFYREEDSFDDNNGELSSQQKTQANSPTSEDLFDDGELYVPLSLEQEINWEQKVRDKTPKLEHSFDDREVDRKGGQLKVSSSHHDSKSISLQQGIRQNGRTQQISSLQHDSPVSVNRGIERSGTALKVSLRHNNINIGSTNVVNNKKPRTKKQRKENRNLMFPQLKIAKKRRRCDHCQAEKTPQWRMGPMGRNTLCNACGLRYKLGRLEPEYRPAASPTSDTTKHSNYYRNIMQKKLREHDNPGKVVNA